MTLTTSIELGTILKRTLTGQLVSVCMITEDTVYWDSESPCIGFESWHIDLTKNEMEDYEVVSNFVRTPSGRVYEGTDNENITLGKRQFEVECNRCIVSSYLEQVFMQEGWQEIFEVQEDLVYGLTDGSFTLLDFISAVNQFTEVGCTHALLELAEAE